MAETREQETCGEPLCGTYGAGVPVIRCRRPKGHTDAHEGWGTLGERNQWPNRGASPTPEPRP